MALPITIPYTFATATSSIPLSQLDSDFTTVVNAINGIGNGTNSLSNVSITGGSIDNVAIGGTTSSTGRFSTVTATTGNITTINATTLNAATHRSDTSLTFQTNGTTTAMTIDTSQNVGIGTSSPLVRLQVQQDQAAYSYFDYYNVTNGGGIVWRQIVRNIANTGTTSVDYAKLIGGGLSINNNDTNAANFTAFGVGASERMRIDSSGNVGIGTSSPTVKLDVRTAAGTAVQQNLYTGSSAAASTLKFGQVGSVAWNAGITATNGDFQIGIDTGGVGYNINRSGLFIDYHSWLTAGSERMRIDSSGNVGIGTSSPGYRLDVQASQAAMQLKSTTSTNYTLFTLQNVGYNYLGVENSTGGALFTGSSAYALTLGTVSAYPLQFATGGSVRATIDSSGNVGIGTANPAGYSAKFATVAAGDYSTAATFISNSSVANWARTDWDNQNVAYNGIIYQDQSGLFNIRNDGANAIAFSTNGGNERMRIDSSGNVGIGTSSNLDKLTVAGGIKSTANINTAAITANSTFIDNFGGARILSYGPNTTTNGTFIFYQGKSDNSSGQTAMSIDANGNVIAGGGAALATTATNGFLYVPTCAGTPTGTPTTVTGMAPIVVNTTNNKLYFYSGGAWRDAGP